jgi:hypothetical protein
MKSSSKAEPGWYFFESCFSGLVPLLYAGKRVSFKKDTVEMHHLTCDKTYIRKGMGMNLEALKEGVCGSAIVVDVYEVADDVRGSVVGFFAYTDGSQDVENVFVPVIAKLIDDGWQVVI